MKEGDRNIQQPTSNGGEGETNAEYRMRTSNAQHPLAEKGELWDEIAEAFGL